MVQRDVSRIPALAPLIEAAGVPVTAYTVTFAETDRAITLKYEGEPARPHDTPADGSSGLAISTEGIALSGQDVWYPVFDHGLVTFSIEVRAPASWEVISQGRRTTHRREAAQNLVGWESPEPQDEIHLVGGPLTEYTRDAGGVTAMAFLRTPDQALADSYLDATGRYLALYSALLGPYPYKKFAMVENVRETGYGMPSFTLLGSTVIRLPFILTSSYPHEILHNWWGNGVFVDVDGGNWSEGLTAYLADHLIQEQRGAGAEYRRAALQKYADYVAEAKDFPLTQFRARHSAATEAVGYGKALMVFHLVRRELGDDAFLRALRGFFEQFRFRRATFADLDRALASAVGRTGSLLAPWVEKAGAPALKVSHAEALRLGSSEKYLLEALVEQTQPGPVYRLRVPVAVTLEGREQAYQTTFRLDTKFRGLELAVPGRPLRLDVDPEFDLFRRLDREELPPALSGLFGAERLLIVLPAGATEPLREGYRRLANAWKVSQPGQTDVVFDDAMEALPNDRAVWLFGWENRFRPAVAASLPDRSAAITDTGARLGDTALGRATHSAALAVRDPAHPDRALGWLAADRAAALPGLGRKLPHYGRYGYVGFEGDEPTNVVKGEWRVASSPMSMLVVQPEGGTITVPMATLAPRRALAP
ncbi:MAG: hypothetical protein A2638_04255 [Nitrospirae bacterium RIFCSPHIGHO2_01_FULL_66_17]|nr:MAG: hypothetical protein A2638_04255 [Nitrospirae bacterium RIFCSPHIGHO2_01_FULL_66_17]